MVRGETLKIILEYVYTGRTHLKEEDAAEILSLADYFQIHDLKRLCCIYIKASGYIYCIYYRNIYLFYNSRRKDVATSLLGTK